MKDSRYTTSDAMAPSHDLRLERETPVGDALVRVYRGGYPMRRVEYLKDGRTWSCEWDGRDDGDTQYVSFAGHDPGDAAAILEAVLPFLGGAVAELVDGVLVYRALGGRSYRVAADNFSPVRIRYHEAGRTLHLDEDPAHTRGMRITLVLPAEPAWTHPAGVPIDADHWREILSRIEAANDRGLDSGFSVRIVIPGHPRP